MSGAGPFDPALMLRRAVELQQSGRLDDAASIYREMLAWAPDHPRVLQMFGVLEAQRGRTDLALALFERVTVIDPNNAAGHYNLGNSLGELGRLEQALAAYDRALGLVPDYAEAWNNRGGILERLKRIPDAIESYDRALSIDGRNVTALFNRAYALTRVNRLDEALGAYGAALAIAPNYAPALNNRGGVFLRLRRLREALADFDRLVAIAPGDPLAHSNRGDSLLALGRLEEALIAYQKAIAIRGDLAAAHRGCGEALSQLHRYEEAFNAFDRGFRLAPELGYLEGNRLHAKMHICDWKDLAAEQQQLIAHVQEGKRAAEPFVLLVTTASSAAQLRCAQTFVQDRYPPMPSRARPANKRARSKIRLGYISGEFREQATAYLTADLFECHDRAEFEIHAFATGADDKSAMRQRLVAAFDRFEDISAKSDSEIANLIVDARIEILVNLNGYFGIERTGVFALRPCPVQVNYLGFPGTMGAPYMDYIVADPIVIPESARKHYAEKVVYLPHSYQPNDRKRPMGSIEQMRADYGLPQSGFVFACFNNSHKLTPDLFAIWMRLLNRIPGSALWLLQANASVERNLRREASERGIASERLVFAPLAKLDEHMSRLRLADLFLDTLPHNAHTTASDALWRGIPVVTCIGDTFAGRVAASLLTSAGLPELITRSLGHYEDLALKLARTPDLLRRARAKLFESRGRCPLFDTPRFVRNLESAYTTMIERHDRGLAPESFTVVDGGSSYG